MGCDAGYYFHDDAYVTMRERVGATEWSIRPDHANGSRMLAHHWEAPYCPPLRTRVLEILAAYEPWQVEYDRLKIAVDFDAKDNAMLATDHAQMVIERAIAATRATGAAGWRIKATIMASTSSNRASVEIGLTEALDGEAVGDAMQHSLLLDMALPSHLGISFAKKSAVDFGVPGNGSIPCFVRNSFVSGMVLISFIQPANCSAIGCGTPAGPKTAHDVVIS